MNGVDADAALVQQAINEVRWALRLSEDEYFVSLTAILVDLHEKLMGKALSCTLQYCIFYLI